MKKEWDIPLEDCEIADEPEDKDSKPHKKIPVYIRIIISFIIYAIVYFTLNKLFPDLAEVINNLAGIFLAVASFIGLIYQSYKKEIENEIKRR